MSYPSCPILVINASIRIDSIWRDVFSKLLLIFHTQLNSHRST